MTPLSRRQMLALMSSAAAFGLPLPGSAQTTPERAGMTLGPATPFSSQMVIERARALAAADLDFDALRDQTDAQIITTLTAVSGIGVWTAEIYAMFALGRADVFAAGDLALQEGARHLFDLPDRPNDRALRAMAQDWQPWRAVAARLLWAYYHVVKTDKGIA